MLNFHASFRSWTSAAAFAAYVDNIRLFAGCNRVVEHHTWRPTLAQWAGRQTIEGIARYYRDTLGWDRGPHLFLTDSVIWEMTPLTMWGIHATIENDNAIGIEHVWNGDDAPFPARMVALSRQVNQILWRKLGYSGRAVTTAICIGHREVPGTTKSCPGWRNDMQRLRQLLGPTVEATTIPGGPEWVRRYRVRYNTYLREGPGRAFPVVASLRIGDELVIDGIKFGETIQASDEWLHTADGRGFLHLSGAVRV